MASTGTRQLRVLSEEQVAQFEEDGYLHVPDIFEEHELEGMDRDLSEMLEVWGLDNVGWIGDWKKEFMDDELAKISKLVGVEGLDLYSSAWARAAYNDRLCDMMVDLLGPNVEYHHACTHVKPPGTGDAVPMHQDSYFYTHQDDRLIAVLVHIDDTDDVNGCIRFIPRTHKDGVVEHVTRDADGGMVVPYLSPAKYPLSDTIPVPARRGDVVLFNYHAIHGSKTNKTNKLRRLVRICYRHPDNVQIQGEWIGRPGPMVRGMRPRSPGQEVLPVPGRLEEEAEGRRKNLEAQAEAASSADS